jgi:hypothetical protein
MLLRRRADCAAQHDQHTHSLSHPTVPAQLRASNAMHAAPPNACRGRKTLHQGGIFDASMDGAQSPAQEQRRQASRDDGGIVTSSIAQKSLSEPQNALSLSFSECNDSQSDVGPATTSSPHGRSHLQCARPDWFLVGRPHGRQPALGTPASGCFPNLAINHSAVQKTTQSSR